MKKKKSTTRILHLPDVVPQFEAYYRKHGEQWHNLRVAMLEGSKARHVTQAKERCEQEEDAEGVSLAELLLVMSQAKRDALSTIIEARVHSEEAL